MNRNVTLSTVVAALAVSCATPAPKPASPSASSPVAVAEGGSRVFVVEPVHWLGLYPHEAQASMVALAGWARSRGLRVVDAEKTWQVLSRARAGRSATTGATCGKPLYGPQALRRWQRLLGANSNLSATVDCEQQGCTLNVDLADGIDGIDSGKAIAHFEAPYARNAPVTRALATALAHLTRKPRSPSGAVDLFGGSLGARRPRDPRAERFGWELMPLWAGGGLVDHNATRPGGDLGLTDVLPGGLATLRACFGADDGAADLLFVAGADGRVTHCEADGRLDPEGICACRVLENDARLPASLLGDRFRANVHLKVAETVTPDGYRVHGWTETHLERYRDRAGQTMLRPKVTDRSIAEWSPPASSAVDRCFADARGATTRKVDLQVRFGPDGRGTGVRITGTGGPKLSQAEAACLRSAFLASRAPCPGSPAPAAAAVVQVRFLATPKTARAR